MGRRTLVQEKGPGTARCMGGEKNGGRTHLVSGTWSCTHSSRSAEPGPADRLVPARAPSRAAPQRRPTRRHTGKGMQRNARTHGEVRRGRRWHAEGGAAQRGTAIHRLLTGRCLLPMMGACTASRIRCGGTSHGAATRHMHATKGGKQLCVAARMRERTQAHTAAGMSACPRASGQARYGWRQPARVPGPFCR